MNKDKRRNKGIIAGIIIIIIIFLVITIFAVIDVTTRPDEYTIKPYGDTVRNLENAIGKRELISEEKEEIDLAKNVQNSSSSDENEDSEEYVTTKYVYTYKSEAGNKDANKYADALFRNYGYQVVTDYDFEQEEGTVVMAKAIDDKHYICVGLEYKKEEIRVNVWTMFGEVSIEKAFDPNDFIDDPRFTDMMTKVINDEKDLEKQPEESKE